MHHLSGNILYESADQGNDFVLQICKKKYEAKKSGRQSFKSTQEPLVSSQIYL